MREAYKGRKAWIPPKAPKGLRLGILADLILGSIGRRSLQDIAGMEVSNVFGSFFDNFTATNWFDQCIQKLFSRGFVQAMHQNRWIPGETALGVLGGARAREAKVSKAWNLLRTLKEPSIRSSGKSLAQGQVALIDPT